MINTSLLIKNEKKRRSSSSSFDSHDDYRYKYSDYKKKKKSKKRSKRSRYDDSHMESSQSSSSATSSSSSSSDQSDVEEAKSSRKSWDKHTQKKGKLNPDALSIFSSKEKQKGEAGMKNKANEENQVIIIQCRFLNNLLAVTATHSDGWLEFSSKVKDTLNISSRQMKNIIMKYNWNDSTYVMKDMVGYKSFKLRIFWRLSANPEYEPQVEVYIDPATLDTASQPTSTTSPPSDKQSSSEGESCGKVSINMDGKDIYEYMISNADIEYGQPLRGKVVMYLHSLGRKIDTRTGTYNFPEKIDVNETAKFITTAEKTHFSPCAML